MSVLHDIRRRAVDAIKPVLAISALLYFGYHLVEGRYGLIARHRLLQQIDVLEAEATTLAAQRAALERRVARFRPDGIDPDLLDEMVRRTLGYARDGDIVVAD